MSRKPVRTDSDAVVDLLRRRPCTVEDVADGLSLNRLEALKRLEMLVARGIIKTSRHDSKVYYQANANASPIGAAETTVRTNEPSTE